MKEDKDNAAIDCILQGMHDHVARLAGNESAAGFQIAGLIRILANQYDNIFSRQDGEDELSGPRMGVLVRLLDEEQRGNPEGITPTVLSHNQYVSRNTISALLRGLEDQGMIERRLDPLDRRLFRIRLTDTGRATVKALGPQRITAVNQIVCGLTFEEQAQLIALLSKLFSSLHTYCQCPADLRGTIPEEKPALIEKHVA